MYCQRCEISFHDVDNYVEHYCLPNLNNIIRTTLQPFKCPACDGSGKVILWGYNGEIKKSDAKIEPNKNWVIAEKISPNKSCLYLCLVGHNLCTSDGRLGKEVFSEAVVHFSCDYKWDTKSLYKIYGGTAYVKYWQKLPERPVEVIKTCK